MEGQGNTFELALKTAASLLMVHIERRSFLRKELSKYCTGTQIDKAIEVNPVYAGVSINIIAKIADSCIAYETNKVSAISFAAGLPGGIAMAGTIPADLAQYMRHLLRILQKLIFLYGWDELISENGTLDDETTNMLTLFMGGMFGVNGAATTITKLAFERSFIYG